MVPLSQAIVLVVIPGVNEKRASSPTTKEGA